MTDGQWIASAIGVGLILVASTIADLVRAVWAVAKALKGEKI